VDTDEKLLTKKKKPLATDKHRWTQMNTDEIPLYKIKKQLIADIHSWLTPVDEILHDNKVLMADPSTGGKELEAGYSLRTSTVQS
jgi:hypothetical protein